MSRTSSLLVVPAVCLGTLLGAGTASARVSPPFRGAPAARATTSHGHKHRHRLHAHTAAHCAKQSNFHASGHLHRKHHHSGCAKRGPGVREGSHITQPASHTHLLTPTHTGDSCPGADLQPSQEDIETIRSATLCLIDRERTDHGEPALAQNMRLLESAQAHSENMVSDDYFEHDGPRGDTPLTRITGAGYIPSSRVGYDIGENIGWGTLALSTPRAIVAAWMASPGHRANILGPHFRETAVGVCARVPPRLQQRPDRRGLHAGLRRDHHRRRRGSDRLTPAAITSPRQHNKETRLWEYSTESRRS